ncbi:MAG: threonine--tRNA ligase [Actinobacteria bacterium]|nr:threonine--tRNA ligase [Actinomycetota bacterium]
MSVKVKADGSSDGFALAKGAGASAPLVQVADGRQRDLSFVAPAGADVEIVTSSDDLGREVTRHSTAHVLAQAVLRLFPGAKYSIGPPIADGFYYDFDVERPFTPDDLEAIEAEMRKILQENQRFEREEIDRERALELFADQPYKLEIINGVPDAGDPTQSEAAEGPVISVYRNTVGGEERFIDLCRGPHVPGTGRIKAFKLMRSAGAYWRGDETKPMLQRIYGTAWESKDALEAYLHRLEEAERRDHRKLGRELELYYWAEEVGPGLPLWQPKGGRVRKKLEDLIRAMVLERGYEPVYTPHIGKGLLWETSGHLDFFAENMFPKMAAEEADYYLKPMNCPFHVMIYRSKTRGYKELPLRLSEVGAVYRYERSGVVHGLLRSRNITQDDSHIFCRPDQVVDEVVGCLDFFRSLYGIVGLGPDRVDFSTKPGKAVGSDELWKLAEEGLVEALRRSSLGYDVAEGEGAFYGPKIDIHVRDAIGRMWQMCTVQVDFQFPERFGLEYVDEHGERKRPVMIHRALYGSVERFMGVLVEHFAGAFPTWLAPVQSVLIPIADRHVDYAEKVARQLRDAGVQVEIDDSDDTMGAKIRRQQMNKVPYMLIVGDQEAEGETVSVRPRTGEEKRGMPVADFVDAIRTEIEERAVELSL